MSSNKPPISQRRALSLMHWLQPAIRPCGQRHRSVRHSCRQLRSQQPSLRIANDPSQGFDSQPYQSPGYESRPVSDSQAYSQPILRDTILKHTILRIRFTSIRFSDRPTTRRLIQFRTTTRKSTSRIRNCKRMIRAAMIREPVSILSLYRISQSLTVQQNRSC